MLFEIESNVPIPAVRSSGRAPKYPFRALQVGHSFFEPNLEEVPRLQRAAAAYAKRAGIKLLTRRMPDPETGKVGLRVWRVS